MKFIRGFIYRPVFTIVIFIVGCLMGMVSLFGLDIEDERQVKSNNYFIRASYSSSIEGVVSGLAKPLESKLISIPGVELVVTDVSHSGVNTEVIFSEDSNYYENMLRLHGALNAIRRDIPQETVFTIGGSDNPNESAMTLYFISDTKTVTEIAGFLNSNIKHIIESINGVSGVNVNVESDNGCKIDVDTGSMEYYNIAYSSVKNTLDNIAVRGGSCNIPHGNSIMHVNVEYDDNQLYDFPIINNKGKMVYLGNLADINFYNTNRDNVSRIGGKETVFVDIQKKEEANLLRVADGIKKMLPVINDMCKAYGISVGIAVDKSDFVQRGISGVVKTIAEAIILVSLIILIFLGSKRMALISILAIPLSIVPMFIILKLMGISINVYSLFGVVLAIGLVVDDAIIVLENIHKYAVKKIEDRRETAYKGTASIADSIIAMTITLAVVYIPILFTGDKSLQHFTDFAISISSSVLVSGFVSLAITPMLYALMHRNPKAEVEETSSHSILSSFSLVSIHNKAMYVLNKIEYEYLKAVSFFVRFRLMFLAAVFGIISILAVILSQAIKVEEGVTVDKGDVFFAITSRRDNEIDVEYKDKKLIRLNEKILEDKISCDIREICTSTSATNKALDYIRLRLIPHSYRHFDVDKIASRVVALHNEEASDCVVFYTPDSSSSSRTLQVMLQVYGGSYEEIQNRVRSFLDHDGIRGIYTGIITTDLRYNNAYNIKINRHMCADYNVSPSNIVSALGAIHQQRFFKRDVSEHTGKIFLGIKCSEQDRKLEEILSIPIAVQYEDSSGQMRHDIVPIAKFVTFEVIKDLNRKYFVNGIGGIQLKLQIKPGLSKTKISQAITTFNKKYSGLCYAKIHVAEERAIKAMRRTYIMFGLSILLIYLIIAALLESFIKAFIVILTVPASALGALLLLLLMKLSVNPVAIIGMITLVGLITKHGIMLVDSISKREKSVVVEDAILEGCHLRFRPIIMTTLCMILGAVPLLNNKVEFHEYKVPIAASIIGGMFFGTLLTMFIVPIFYSFVASLTGAEISDANKDHVIRTIIEHDVDETED